MVVSHWKMCGSVDTVLLLLPHCKTKKLIFFVQILRVLQTILTNDYNDLRNRTSEPKKFHACVLCTNLCKKKEFAGNDFMTKGHYIFVKCVQME